MNRKTRGIVLTLVFLALLSAVAMMYWDDLRGPTPPATTTSEQETEPGPDGKPKPKPEEQLPPVTPQNSPEAVPA